MPSFSLSLFFFPHLHPPRKKRTFRTPFSHQEEKKHIEQKEREKCSSEEQKEKMGVEKST